MGLNPPRVRISRPPHEINTRRPLTSTITGQRPSRVIRLCPALSDHLRASVDYSWSSSMWSPPVGGCSPVVADSRSSVPMIRSPRQKGALGGAPAIAKLLAGAAARQRGCSDPRPEPASLRSRQALIVGSRGAEKQVKDFASLSTLKWGLLWRLQRPAPHGPGMTTPIGSCLPQFLAGFHTPYCPHRWRLRPHLRKATGNEVLPDVWR